ncbi:PREDICTED: L-2-hydroxyglutarate dehydrogenase, mitochondrial isoform X1 [Rhagoletis zephyria]|uniref:L-2-hydroxyglutarate dehydrogenase, mitochondrial isoform X1 n=1 Tax=Rhagoletis zephyria TaxID=28612 RepID=UPI0008116B77|nr:PREDICTED: L-2-hydroxyglutarate dehydrogenase, mitochondrial isoform X1 [Rhagoletis zephyria]
MAQLFKSIRGTVVLTQKLSNPASVAATTGQRWFRSIQNDDYDLVVVGGGIVGVASAREILLRHPHLRVGLLEKEHKLAVHQSGHNSGVIHAGIYYKPGSLKAKLCVQGMHLAYDFLNEKKIPYKKVGKLIVATSEDEVGRLMDLYERGQKNLCPDLKLIDENEIKEIEPYCEGVKAIHSPHTGIVDWGLVTEYYAQDFKQAGGDVHLNFKVSKFLETSDKDADKYPVTIRGARDRQQVRTRYVLTCGGLQSDKLAELTGCPRDPRIIPFRGEYLLLSKEKQHMVRGNIYPVPDPNLPFLGVHFTPRMDGSVWLGPNAVLAFKREGYNWNDINLLELFDAVRHPGFLKMATRHLKFGLCEMSKSIFIRLQTKELQKFIPEINEFDISAGPAGVRAQAMDSHGNLVDDFVFDKGEGKGALAHQVLHCRNAPSPGATSSLAIAKMIADKLEKEFDIKC